MVSVPPWSVVGRVFELHLGQTKYYKIGLFDGVYHQFQQYFSCIMAVSFIGGGHRENHRPVASH